MKTALLNLKQKLEVGYSILSRHYQVFVERKRSMSYFMNRESYTSKYYTIVNPPSITRLESVVYVLTSESRYSIYPAISIGSAYRFIGYSCLLASTCSSEMLSLLRRGVFTRAGDTQFTRTPRQINIKMSSQPLTSLLEPAPLMLHHQRYHIPLFTA